MKFYLNEDAKTIHGPLPQEPCNLDDARKLGPKQVVEATFSAASLARWELGYKPCEHCLEPNAVKPT